MILDRAIASIGKYAMQMGSSGPFMHPKSTKNNFAMICAIKNRKLQRKWLSDDFSSSKSLLSSSMTQFGQAMLKSTALYVNKHF